MIRLLLLLILVAMPAAADPVADAEAAAERLRQAGLSLSEAEGTQNRVRALTETIRAYEDGLSVLRDALRDAALRERIIRDRFEREAEQLSRFLAALQAMGQSPEATVLLHPSGAIGTARASILMAEAVPAMSAEAERLRGELEEIRVLSLLRRDALGTLEDGLASVQAARTELAAAVAERRNPPAPTDLAAMEALLNSAETLDAFASSIAPGEIVEEGAFEAAKGRLPLPVQGLLLAGFNEPDASGLSRPGVLVATAPRALVTSPWPATVRYAGPLLDYGNVIILEPESGYLLVLAGLGDVYAVLGQVVGEGDPIGLMSGHPEPAQGILIENPGAGDRARTETLYMELRADDGPVNPADWFSFGNG